MGTSKILIDGVGIDLTQDTVAANKMLSGTKAHDSNGDSVTGNIQSKNAATYTPTTSDQTIAAGQYLSGAQTVKGDANLLAGNIKSGVSIFGVDGTLEAGGGGGVPTLSKGVNFIDYDGTAVATWETSTVASKTALPDNPTHDGLTAQGWNWSLADIQSYIATYPDAVVWVGQMYIPNDGKTRIYIHLEEGRLSPYLGICPNGSVDIDWGDGSAHDTVTGTSVTSVKNTQHTYANGGDYVITLTVTGSMGIPGTNQSSSQLLWKNSTSSIVNRVYQTTIQNVMIGNGVTSIDTYAFAQCSSLASITIPSSVTSIGNYAFQSCSSLTSITIPSSVTSIVNYAVQFCRSLASITIPNSVTSIGNYAFQGCYTLASITIPSSVTSIGAYAFENCLCFTNTTIPNSVKSIANYAFAQCYNLTSITISNNVTGISNYAFYNCYTLTSITIPNSVKNIYAAAFYNCYGLSFVKFTSQTPPTVANSNVWTNLPTDCIIYVPTGTLSAYRSATNYPSSSTYPYVEY